MREWETFVCPAERPEEIVWVSERFHKPMLDTMRSLVVIKLIVVGVERDLKSGATGSRS